MELQEVTPTLCVSCQHEIQANSNFCQVCGQAQNHEEVKFHSGKKKNLQQIALFFAVELILCISAQLIDDFNIKVSFFFDGIMAISAILFFSYSWDENKYLLKWPGFSFKKLTALVIATIITSFLVQIAAEKLNQVFFNKDYTYYFTYATEKYGNYLMVISVALFPALFEELAYRGFLMQKLLNVVDKNEAIYITSIIFFLMHFSMISFYWMLPFAFLLAYVRLKENTLWYGVIMHFCFNLISCLVDIYKFS